MRHRLKMAGLCIGLVLAGVVGGFQPDKMCRSFEGDADGIYARFLYAWPKEPPYAKPVDTVAEIEPEVVNAFNRLIRLPDGEGESFVPRDVPLTSDAFEAFAAFTAFADQGKKELDGREREYFCKGTAHVCGLRARWPSSSGRGPADLSRKQSNSVTSKER